MGKSLPLRMCLGCREPKPKTNLIRIVKTPEGSILLVGRGKVSGRGAYICRSRACFDKAFRSKALERSLSVSIPEEIYEAILKKLDEQ
ncbi:MAG: YlxR family protein [Oscillospiraceae bacterium]|nr:YlxR family protein [Oscillospiraceae bacterium]